MTTVSKPSNTSSSDGDCAVHVLQPGGHHVVQARGTVHQVRPARPHQGALGYGFTPCAPPPLRRVCCNGPLMEHTCTLTIARDIEEPFLDRHTCTSTIARDIDEPLLDRHARTHEVLVQRRPQGARHGVHEPVQARLPQVVVLGLQPRNVAHELIAIALLQQHRSAGGPK